MGATDEAAGAVVVASAAVVAGAVGAGAAGAASGASDFFIMSHADTTRGVAQSARKTSNWDRVRVLLMGAERTKRDARRPTSGFGVVLLFMVVMSCPHCGMQAQIPDGISPYLCGFCRRSFQVGGGGGGPTIVFRPAGYSSGWSMYWTIRLAAIALVALVSAGGWIYHRMTGKQIAGVTDLDDDNDVWTGAKPLSCDGNDQLTFTGVTATFAAGPALSAGGNCQVTCTGCTLRAPFAVQANGNAKVVIVGGTLDGQVAVAATANATVEVRGDTKVSGTVSKSGNATVTGIAAPPAASSSPVAHASAATAPPHAPASAKPAGKKK
jgi:hypothetical protein